MKKLLKNKIKPIRPQRETCNRGPVVVTDPRAADRGADDDRDG